ncbi:MAG: DUF5329 domain-containing protein [Desulfobulbales bacterium]
MMHKGIFLIILRQAAAGLLCLLMLLSFYISCAAGTSENITSLLLFIEQSECTFIRNGKHYDALKAREHIEKKYTYYKERITTAEDFILYSATKSSITGEPYRVICSGVNMVTSDWLKEELAELRTR